MNGQRRGCDSSSGNAFSGRSGCATRRPCRSGHGASGGQSVVRYGIYRTEHLMIARGFATLRLSVHPETQPNPNARNRGLHRGCFPARRGRRNRGYTEYLRVFRPYVCFSKDRKSEGKHQDGVLHSGGAGTKRKKQERERQSPDPSARLLLTCPRRPPPHTQSSACWSTLLLLPPVPSGGGFLRSEGGKTRARLCCSPHAT